MDKLEIYEELRALLREPQSATVANPWTYADADFVPQIRSALRHLRVRGLGTTAVMSVAGVLSVEPDEREAMLITLFVAERLISGDLLQKLNDGELGVIFKAGSDMIDTKQAAKAFEASAAQYRTDFNTLLTIALSASTDPSGTVFSGQVQQTDTGELV